MSSSSPSSSSSESHSSSSSVVKRHKSRSHSSSAMAGSEDTVVEGRTPQRRLSSLSIADIQQIASQNIRRSTYGPEFLKDLARKGMPHVASNEGGKFKIVTGSEAASIYESFLGDGAHQRKPREHTKSILSKPVVFAFTVQDAGSKVMDYYMTWKGKQKLHRLKERKADFLEQDFDKILTDLETQHKRMSVLSDAKVLPPLPTPPEEEAPVDKTDANETSDSPLVAPKRPLISRPESNLSVASLPFLTSIPNVPVGNRLPLRVVNPDRSSLLSSGVTSPRMATFVSSPLRENTTIHNATVQESHAKVPVPSKPPVDQSLENSDSPIKVKSSERHHRTSSERRSESSSDSDSEILIVLVDDKEHKKRRPKSDNTWHGLERRVSTNIPERKPSLRSSPWNGPITHSVGGELYRYAPELDADSESTSVEQESDGETPNIPLRTALTALGYLSGSQSPASKTYSYPYSPAHSASYVPMPTPYNTPYTSPYNFSEPVLPFVTPPLSPYGSAVMQPVELSPYSVPLSRSHSWSATTPVGGNVPLSVYTSPYIQVQSPY